jgi:hypothetical protein
MVEQRVTENTDAPKTSLVPIRKTQNSTSTVDPSCTWYLGGNHSVKLLFSVDGDFDPKVLNNLTEVPSVVGELALSVESLVSHDLTVGGFENDLLAKITSNTLAAKRSFDDIQASKPSNSEPTIVVKHQRSPSMDSFSVPNPLIGSSYKPVPNPLSTLVTPPDSPASISSEKSRKRKAPAVIDLVKAKVLSRCKVSTVNGIKAAQ